MLTIEEIKKLTDEDLLSKVAIKFMDIFRDDTVEMSSFDILALVNKYEELITLLTEAINRGFTGEDISNAIDEEEIEEANTKISEDLRSTLHWICAQPFIEN